MGTVKSNSCLNYPAYQALKTGVGRFHEDPDKLEQPFGDGCSWRLIIDHQVTLLVGIYRHVESNDPMLVLESGIGNIPEDSVQRLSEYAASAAIELAFPARLLLRQDGEEKVFVVNLRSPAYLLREEFIPDILSALVGIAKHERRQLLELGVKPFEFPKKKAA